MKKNLVYTGLLLLNAAAFVFFGLKWLFSPVVMATGLGIHLTNADAITDAQAVYGGLELGVGVFLVVCALKPAMQFAGLLAATLALSGLALCRGLGIVLATDHVTGATWQLLATDITGSTLNALTLIVASRRMGKDAPAQA